jgi:hypothetical protein
VYTLIDRRKVNLARLDETTALAQVEFFPKLQAADGFGGFYLVASGDTFTAIFVWADQAKAEAFDGTYRAWTNKLEEFGHRLETEDQGETVIALEPQA